MVRICIVFKITYNDLSDNTLRNFSLNNKSASATVLSFLRNVAMHFCNDISTTKMTDLFKNDERTEQELVGSRADR